MSWGNAFGGISPSQSGYEAIELSANTPLYWPVESSSTPVVAGSMAVTPTAANLQLQMPDATQGAPGLVGIATNVGNVAFALTDTNGALIADIAPGISWIIFLTDNGTPAGAWLAIQLGATTSNAQAAALAGAGLQALATQLQSFIQTFELNTNTLITTEHRASGIVWTGGSAGTLQLDAISTLTAGWWALITNEATEAVTVTTSGSDTINLVAEVVIPAGGSGNPYSLLVVAASDGFNTFAGTPAIIPIDGGGTGADNAGDALINLGGSTIGIEIFEAPDAAAILALLDIGPSAFTEASVASNQVITPSSINTAFVATVPISMALPVTGSVTDSFLFAVYAQGGAVTFIPDGADAINGQAAGANFVIPQGASLIMVTDADGNWWPLFFYNANGIPLAVAGGTADAITVVFQPVDTAITDNMLRRFVATGANTITNPTLADSALAASTITKNGGEPLAVNDIPGAGAICLVQYRTASTSWELLNPGTNLDLFGNVQGDVLYRGATGWKTLAPGTAGQVLQSGGAGANPLWGTNTGRLLASITYGAAGSYAYMVPNNCTLLEVQVIGAGGGGAGASIGAAQFSSDAGGGGGAGAYAHGFLTDHAAGSTVTVTVGPGGGGGASGVNGSNGGSSSFGADIVAGGGQGGVCATPNNSAGLSGVGPGGIGGTVATIGSVANVQGSPGGIGIAQNKSFGGGGNGGPSFFGGGGAGGITVAIGTQVNGSDANTGGGGGGGAGVYSNGGAQVATGGNGSAGVVIIRAYT